MAGLDLAILGGKPMHDDDHEYGHGDAHGSDEPNHEFESAAADAFHAAKSNDLDGFKKALYNAVCAVRDEEEDDDDSDEG